MTWKTAYRSFYYDGAPKPADPMLQKGKVALLVIDVQNTYFDRPDPATLKGAARERYHAWTPFHERMEAIVIPNLKRLLSRFREGGLDVLFARIACLRKDGRDRSLSQRKPGWNDLLLPKDEHASQLPEAIAPMADEIVVTKTTDSALTGTNLRIDSHQSRHHSCCLHRDLHRSVRLLDRAQLGGRELRRDRGRRRMRGRDARAARS